jgi:hypothetical protein
MYHTQYQFSIYRLSCGLDVLGAILCKCNNSMFLFATASSSALSQQAPYSIGTEVLTPEKAAAARNLQITSIWYLT